MSQKKTVCFTGHRSIEQIDKKRLKRALDLEIQRQISLGASRFRAGGAVGVDTLAALAVLDARRKNPEIRLDLILPCRNQTLKWSFSDAAVYERILKRADSVTYVSDSYFDGVMQLRNRALVDGADTCVAYLRTSRGSGSAYTAAYAIRSGLEFVNLAEEMSKIR